ncbi:MAG: biotin--protein ligase [Desulfovibrionaceae bacterium]|jgi:hypothetical protein|nr:biotin--protein ligase [Desulfovibrionaceae bacterium]
MSSLCILWDESHIWGLLAWRAAHALGVPYRIARGPEIAHALDSRKSAALLVPGGVARRKALALGEGGMDAVRAFVDRGGAYLGFCGGAGLGLSGRFGLGLCPWRRAPIKDRVLHLISGHIVVDLDPASELCPAEHRAPLVPVWWPARFEAGGAEGAGGEGAVRVLARYRTPGPDFWVADLPLSSLPEGTFADWETLYGLKLRPADMAGQPCIVHGNHGRGRYVLSYAHLETPAATQANALLCHILRTAAPDIPLPPAGPDGSACPAVPEWDLAHLPPVWDDGLARAEAALDEVLRVGQEQYLLFPRNGWLFGWRAGLPGANLNHLYSLVRQVRALEPPDAARALWRERREEFLARLDLFRRSVTGYLLAERLAMTLAKTLPDAISQEGLVGQRTALFGEPMEHGGLYAELLDVLDDLAYLCVRAAADARGAE